MTKTEQAMIQKIEAKGYAYFESKRAYNVLARVQANYPHLRFSFSINTHSFGGRSDWNSPKREACYEVSVRPK